MLADVKWYQRRGFWAQLAFGGCLLMGFAMTAVGHGSPVLGWPMTATGVIVLFAGAVGIVVIPK